MQLEQASDVQYGCCNDTQHDDEIKKLINGISTKGTWTAVYHRWDHQHKSQQAKYLTDKHTSYVMTSCKITSENSGTRIKLCIHMCMIMYIV